MEKQSVKDQFEQHSVLAGWQGRQLFERGTVEAGLEEREDLAQKT